MFPSNSYLNRKKTFNDSAENIARGATSNIAHGNANIEGINAKTATPNPIDHSQYSNLKCSTCNKYLSVAPIFISSDGSINICGRCPAPTGRPFYTRNEAFENVLKLMNFPCSLSKNCTETLSWANVQYHEEICEFKSVPCPVYFCYELVEMPRIFDHFKDQHSSQIFTTNHQWLPLNTTDFFTKTVILLQHKTDNFLICLVREDNNIWLDVYKPVRTKTDFSYSVSISSKNAVLELTKANKISLFLGKQILTTQRSAMKINFKYSCLKNVLREENDDPTQLCWKIFESNVNHLRNQYKEFIKSALECPVCFDIMSGDIFLCLTGHSMCRMCRGKLDRCPICKCTFTNGRNFSLEGLYTKISKNKEDKFKLTI